MKGRIVVLAVCKEEGTDAVVSEVLLSPLERGMVMNLLTQMYEDKPIPVGEQLYSLIPCSKEKHLK